MKFIFAIPLSLSLLFGGIIPSESYSATLAKPKKSKAFRTIQMGASSSVSYADAQDKINIPNNYAIQRTIKRKKGNTYYVYLILIKISD